MRPVHWLRDLLKRPLQLERRGLQVHVVLGPTAPAPLQAAPELTPGEVLRRGHAELQALLARHPEVRHLMRHLGFIEQALARFGSRALKREVPLQVLRKGLEQLDLLARDEPSAGLADLRERIAAAIRQRARPDEPDLSSTTEVSEASHSLFDEMERSWTGEIPLPKAQGAA